jgi:hypothetical protein
MEDNVEQAKNEIGVIAPVTPVDASPVSIDEIIANLKGFGLSEVEEILTIKCKGRRDLRLKISNIPTSDEMLSIQAVEDFKGYLWIKRVKVEILSRSFSWIDGIDIRALAPDKRFVSDPTDEGKVRDIQVVLRNLITGWGQEVMEVLWKVLMTHSQNIEDRLKEQFPDSAVMTEVEQRLFEQARKQIEERNQVIIDETVSKLYETDLSDSFSDVEEPKT